MKGYVSVCPFDYLIAMKCQQNLAGAVGNRTYQVRVNAVGNRTYRVGVHAVRLETAPTGPGEKYRITEVFTEHAYYFKITIFRVAE